MPVAAKIDPRLLGYGDTFGSYGGRLLGDTDLYATAIDASKLNIGTLADPVELNPYEKTIRDFVLARLGHPVVRVELTDFRSKLQLMNLLLIWITMRLCGLLKWQPLLLQQDRIDISCQHTLHIT